MRRAQQVLRSVKQRVILHYAGVSAQPWERLWAIWSTRLPPPKAAAISRLREPADRNASLLGLALLESALLSVGLVFDPAEIAYPASGKPQLRGGPDFSISHAGGLVGCAVALRGSVGFDLEAVGAVTVGQLRLALGAAEHAELAAGARDPTVAWVQSEAALKALGLRAAQAPRVRLAGVTASVDDSRLFLSPAQLGPDHVAWLAHSSPEIDLTTVECSAGGFAELS